MIFLTHGHPAPTYVSVEDLFTTEFPQGSVIVPLARDPRIFQTLRERGIAITEEPRVELVAARLAPERSRLTRAATVSKR